MSPSNLCANRLKLAKPLGQYIDVLLQQLKIPGSSRESLGCHVLHQAGSPGQTSHARHGLLSQRSAPTNESQPAVSRTQKNHH